MDTAAMVGAFSAPMLIDPGTERKAWQRARQLELQERRALERQEWQTYGF